MSINSILGKVKQGLSTTGATAPNNTMMAPDFYKQMSDTGNQMLHEQGMGDYQPMQSPYFSNQFAENHPVASGALGGAMGVLGNMGPTPQVSGWGDGLARVAAGVTGNMQMQRQFRQSQAMMPMALAQNVMNYRKSQMEMQKMQAPEVVQGKYGEVFQRNPLTGEMSPMFDAFGKPTPQGMGTSAPVNTGTGGVMGDAIYKQMRGAFPDASPEEDAIIRSQASTAAQDPDPVQRSNHIQAGIQFIQTKRQQQQQHEDNEADRHQQFQATQVQRQIANQLAQNKYDESRNDLVPQAVNTQMQVAPIMQNLNDLEAKLKPLKGHNWPMTFFGERAQYALGHAPKGGVLDGNDIAAASVSQIQGGAAWMKAAGSRNPMIFMKAQEHIFDPWKDSPDLALDKIANLKKNMTDMYNEAAILGHKHNFNPTAMDASGQIVQQNSGAPMNFNPNPMVAPGMGVNNPATPATTGKYSKYKVGQ